MLDELECEALFDGDERYLGQTIWGVKDGAGLWTNGYEYYEGYWEHGHFHGEGWFVNKDGDIH